MMIRGAETIGVIWAGPICDWFLLARQANWNVAALARKKGVSKRTLERLFAKEKGKKPKAWLVELRQSWAVKLLNNGCSVKETASHLGYLYPTHFSREFKRYWGYSPTNRPNVDSHIESGGDFAIARVE